MQIFMFKFANKAYPIIGGPVVMFYVSDFTVNVMVFDYVY